MRNLYLLQVGDSSTIVDVLSTGILKERMMALGFTKGARIKAIRKGPKDNLTLYSIRGAMIALRKEESKQVLIDS